MARLVLLLVGIFVGACHVKPSRTVDRPLLWSIEKDGRTSYLFGTMHRGVNPKTGLPPVVFQKLEVSRSFAMETDLAGAATYPVLRTDGTSLRDELGPAYWTKLENALGVNEAGRLVSFKPMIPATLVSMRGLPETNSIDDELHMRARQGNKQIVFLEPLAAQFAVLEKWLDVRALKDMLDDLPAGERNSKALLAAYLAGDEAKILAIPAHERELWLARGRPAAEYDAQLEEVLYRRNASWIAPIEKLHAEGGGFIAVGALHAVGPRSIPELLRQRGYTVTRLER